MNIQLRAAEGTTHHDTAAQCLLIINSLWVVLSLAGRDGLSQHIGKDDMSELSEALNVYGLLGLMFTNTLYAQVEEMELERRRKAASEKGGE